MDKSELFSLLTEAKRSMPSNKYSNYHLNTVENYIKFFDQIKLPVDREEVFKTLHTYLSLIQVQGNVDFDDSLYFFKKFISPLIVFYEKEFGFTTYVKPWIFLSWYFLIFSLLYFITRSIWVLAAVTILFSFYFFVNQKNKKEGRVQAFKY